MAVLLAAGLAPPSLRVAAASAPATARVLSQSTTVMPGADGAGRFSIAFSRPGGGGATTVATRLYAPLSTRSGFLSALSPTGPTSEIAETAPLSLSCLPRVGPEGAGRRLSIAVLTSADGAPAPRTCQGAVADPAWTLRCTLGGGRCSGVYPVVLELRSGSQVTTLTTFLTFTEAPAVEPLRAAPVLTLGPTTSASEVAGMAGALRTSGAAAADVVLAPQAAHRLAGSEQGRRALAELSSATAADREVVRSPFTTVDPGALAASGLSGQIAAQATRGDRLLRRAGIRSTASAGWIATAPVTASTAAGLRAIGIDRLLVPDSSLATPTSASLSWGEPFALPGSPGTTALAADAILSAQMVPGADPVLAAERLLADLALLHLERPSLSIPLGVVLLAPQGWSPSPAFVTTLLRGLSGNPLVASATLSSLYATLTMGANGVATTRSLAAAGPSTPWPAPQVADLLAGQARVAALSVAITGGHHVVRDLSDRFLSAESDRLGTTQRTAALGVADGAIAAQLAQVGIGGSDITLTSLKGTLPITLTKTADWSLVGRLTVRSDHLRFPRGRARPVMLDHPTQSVRIPVVAETTGDLTVSVTLTTPSGRLVLARQRVVVRTTQTSAAAIVLTIGAALVLLVWWVRTSLRRPRRRGRR